LPSPSSSKPDSHLQGDIITIIAEDDSGWWQGQNQTTGSAGIFPAAYLAPKLPDGAIAVSPGSAHADAGFMEFKAGVVAAEAHDFEKAIKHYENAIVYNKKNPE